MCVVLLAACTEGREAGDLWGQWRMDGSDTKYLSFSGEITLFRSLGQGEVFGKFQHQGDSLFIQCFSFDNPVDTMIVEQTFDMKPFSNIRLKIEQLDGDRLVVSKGSQRWGFEFY